MEEKHLFFCECDYNGCEERILLTDPEFARITNTLPGNIFMMSKACLRFPGVNVVEDRGDWVLYRKEQKLVV